MIKVGVTGGIGSGKSTVCKIFECLGVPVFRADDEGRRLLNEDASVIKQVSVLFGDAVMTDGKPDRKKIAGIVFDNSDKLTQLNAIIHPAVKESFERWLAAKKAPLIIKEAAILFESGANKGLDIILVVSSPERLRIERVSKRDKLNADEVKRRMQNQWDEKKKIANANYVVVNDGSTMLIPQILNVYKELIKATGK